MGSERESEIESFPRDPAAPEVAAGKAPSPAEDRLAELAARCAELEERWLRSQADYQNLRRRGQSDAEAALRRTLQPLFADLLLVLDFLDLALSSPATNEEARNLSTGVQLTRTRLLQALEGAGLEEIPSRGTFDPTVHEAAGSRPAEGVASGSILEMARKGYRWRGQVVRPARVIIATESHAGSAAPDRPGPLAPASDA